MNAILAGIIFAVVLLAGILVLLEIGRRVGLRRIAEEGETASKGLSAIEGAIFGLLGLILAFLFQGRSHALMQRGISSWRKRMTSVRHGYGFPCSQQTPNRPCANSFAAIWTRGSKSIGECQTLRIWKP